MSRKIELISSAQGSESMAGLLDTPSHALDLFVTGFCSPTAQSSDFKDFDSLDQSMGL
jgi:hypothetical protein